MKEKHHLHSESQLPGVIARIGSGTAGQQWQLGFSLGTNPHYETWEVRSHSKILNIDVSRRLR